MAAVIGDFIAGPSRFHTMIASPSIQHQHSHSHSHSHPQPHPHSNSRDDPAPSPARYRSLSGSRPSTTPRAQCPDPAVEYSQPVSPPPTTTASSLASSPSAPTDAQALVSEAAGGRSLAGQAETLASSGGASRFPSPPSSSSPSVSTGPAATHDATRASTSMEDPIRGPVSGHPSGSGPAPAAQQQQPSPPTDDFPISEPSSYLVSDATPTPNSPPQTVIHVRDLAHVQSLARGDMLAGNGAGMLNDQPLQQMKYEISAMPIGDIIEMVAALLTKITTTNDLQHDAMSRNVTHQQQANQTNESSGSSTMSPLSHSVLAFHGKNVPAITILSYLSRIHKYCPTTYEVFLSLLVYFDRMTERVNDMVTKAEEARRHSVSEPSRRSSASVAPPPSVQQPQDTHMHDDADLVDSDESDSDLADDDDDDMAESPAEPSRHETGKVITAQDEQPAMGGPATYFVVDSFNIHRLIIAGVTCASKFFSDVFYTNSRYAKVGGLPLAELNHLELQFLVLNDFRLAVPVEDLEAYATMLVEFYAREVVAQRPATATGE